MALCTAPIDPFCLVIIYRYLSRFWDAHKGSMLHFISIKTLAYVHYLACHRSILKFFTRCNTSLSPDHRLLAISNHCTGFDIYDLNSDEPVMSMTHAIRKQIGPPVSFVHGGHALLGGSSTGRVNLWDVESGRRLHSLVHCGIASILFMHAESLNTASSRGGYVCGGGMFVSSSFTFHPTLNTPGLS